MTRSITSLRLPFPAITASRSILPPTGLAGFPRPCFPRRNLATSASSSSPIPWTRLVRFIPANSNSNNSNEWVYGEPITLEKDGSLPEDTSQIKAKLIQVGADGDVFGKGVKVTETVVGVKKLLSPLARVPIFLCIGLNYHLHAKETNQPVPRTPVLFTKPSNALNSPGEPVVIPKCATNNQADYEVEMAIVMGRTGKDIKEGEVMDYVAGYTVANDISARKWQGNLQSNQWTFAKSFDSWCPLGPQIVSSTLINPSTLPLRTFLNGKKMQESNTSDLIFGVEKIVSFLSQGTTIEKGTVILTGTPSGVGFKRDPPVFLQDGDSVTVEIDGIGKLTNSIVYEKK